MSEKQKTINQEFPISGNGLHTGHKVNLRFKPAAEDTGICFIRTDLPGSPIIKADYSNIVLGGQIPRCTSIGRDKIIIHTIEHLMSVLCGLGIDNLTIEIDGNELPGLDGSGLEFLKAIKKAGIMIQNADRKYFDVKETVSVEDDDSAIYISPAGDFKISYTLEYEHPFLRAQYFSTTLNTEMFEKEIAPCRTFCLESEASELRQKGLGKGANYQNTLVVGNKGVIDNKVRFENEFARHKVLDFIGDLYLLGAPIHGHVTAVKSGHKLNLELLKKLSHEKSRIHESVTSIIFKDKEEIDIHGIMKILPHRYPFLMVDRVYQVEKGKRAIGIKNVTINDNFFQGHFPTKPMMPGVLIVEAMAQTAGVVVLTNDQHLGEIAFFMAADKVKFRKVVSPGDQIMLEVEVIRDRVKTAQIRGQAKVNGEIVAEAQMLFSFTKASYLD